MQTAALPCLSYPAINPGVRLLLVFGILLDLLRELEFKFFSLCDERP